MTLTFHVWHLFLVVTGFLAGVNGLPVASDTYGVGAMLRFFATVGGILLLWLVYFAGRFVLG